MQFLLYKKNLFMENAIMYHRDLFHLTWGDRWEMTYYNQLIPWLARQNREDKNIYDKLPAKHKIRKQYQITKISTIYFKEDLVKKNFPKKMKKKIMNFLENYNINKKIQRHATPTLGIELNPIERKREILIIYGIQIHIEF